jgi:hypothetical protein
MGTMPNSGIVIENPIGIADSHVTDTEKYVKAELKTHRDTAATALTDVASTISALGSIGLTLPGDVIPLPNVEFDVDLGINVAPITPTDFGSIADWTVGPAPNAGNLPSIDDVTIDKFVPSISGLVIPDPPPQRIIATPGDAPASPGFTYPKAPVLSFPDEPILTPIDIPTFSPIVLPNFDPTFPIFKEINISTTIDWQEPIYTEEIIDEVINKIRLMLDGGFAINPVIEQGILDRGRDREDRLVRQAVQQAIDEFANRGFSEPPGLLVDRIDAIREDGTLKKLGLNRELVIKVFEEEVANLRFAVQQGIAAEQLYLTLFLAATERLFEVKKLDLDAQLRLYDIQVTIFNAKMREVEIQAMVYETHVRGELARVEVFKALIDAELAKAEVNKAVVESYTAQIQARETFVRVYEAEIRAVGLQAEVFATEILAFRSTVEAYAAEIGAEKLKFDAYEAQIRGEVGKASIVESEAKAYTAEIEGIRAGVSAQVERVRGETNKIQAEIAAYAAELQGSTAKAGVQLGQIQAAVSGYQADTQRYIASLGVEEAGERVKLAAWEGQNKVDIAYFEAQMSKFRVDLEGLIQQARLGLDALKATGDISSTISAGTLAAMHLGATINGGAQITGSGSQGVNFGESFAKSYSKSCGTNKSVTYSNPKTDPNIDCEFA